MRFNKNTKRITAAVSLICFALLPLFSFGIAAFAAEAPSYDGFVPMSEIFRLEDGDGSQPYQYEKIDGFYLTLDYMTSDRVGMNADGAIYGKDKNHPEYDSISQTISGKPSVSFTRENRSDGFTVSGTYNYKHTYPGGPGSAYQAGENIIFNSDLTLTISNISFEDCHVFADITGHLNATGGRNDVLSDSESIDLAGTHLEGGYKFDSDNDTVSIVFHVAKPGADILYSNASLVFKIVGVLPKGEEPVEEETDDGITKFSGRLTYTNGAVNKHGQPWPDLMDFDGDGDIDYADRALQHILVHNPDALDTPEGAALVFTAVIAALLGAGGGAAASVVSGGLGSLGSSGGFDFDLDFSDDDKNGENAAQPDAKEDLGPYIKKDSDGDLNVKDPATGEERLYKANGDGTYTNPLTGATYTEQELKASLESRADNAGLIRQDNAEANEAINSQREENGKKSLLAEEYEKEKAAQLEKEKQEQRKEAYTGKLMDKYGKYTEEELREKIGEEQGKAEIEGYEQREYEKEYEKSQKYTENVKAGADIAIDVLAEIEPTGAGKLIKDGYAAASAAASNAGDVMAGYKTVGGAIAQTVVDTGAELLKNHANGAAQSYAANIFGDSAKAMSDTYMKGGSLEDIRKAGEGAAISGGINATVDAGFDAFGGKATEKLGLSGDKVIGKLGGQEITKEAAGEGAGTLADDIVKNAVSPEDEDEQKLTKLREAQEKAEEDANRQAAEHFRESQKEWAERKNNKE